MLISFTTTIIVLVCQCESKDRFYRPNMPEKLCTIGIIDADDTTNFSFSIRDMIDMRNSLRFITFEKSFQREFPADITDSLRELSFKISTDKEEIFDYQSYRTIKNLLKLEFPDSLKFFTDEKYYLNAQVMGCPEISAEVTVPKPPSEITLISINREITSLLKQLECYHPFDSAYAAVLRISFNKNNEQSQFYAMLVDGAGPCLPSSPSPYSGPLDLIIRESNTQGFIAEMQGLNMLHHNCTDGQNGFEISSAYAFFIDGNNIPGNTCDITLSVPFHDSSPPLVTLDLVRIKLLSIPEELYLFEKSLYTYDKNKGDPFSEPIYLNGNIKGGNGVFAICRSTSLKLDLHWH